MCVCVCMYIYIYIYVYIYIYTYIYIHIWVLVNIIVSGNGFFADYYFPFAGLSPSLSRNIFAVVVVV